MNAKNFEKWVKDQLLPALNALHKPCVIVIDNAPYHSQQLDKAPVASAKKDDMKT
jgi:prophage antirepressor-like protein